MLVSPAAMICLIVPFLSRRFSNHGAFQEILNELNDYAGQRELIAENMMTGICVELTKYLQELKQERKTVSEGGGRHGGEGGGKKEGTWEVCQVEILTWYTVSSQTAAHLLRPLPSPAPV